MPDDLYDRDFVEWSETQAALLRRLGAGERVNAEVDWLHLVDEVEDLGREQVHACGSLLRQAMIHLLKLHGGAEEPAAHWREEVLTFLTDAASRFTPSMRGRIDIAAEYARACRVVRQAGYPIRAPESCPWRLDDLLDGGITVDDLLAKL